ncbi:MAG: YbbR-like domain-containing protein [Bacteroidota bacterium]
MLKKVLLGLNKRKAKVFLLFLVSSFLAWFLSNLSESYESRANFVLNYRNLPDTLLLSNDAVTNLEAKLKTSGFQFLYYNFNSKRVNIDLSQVEKRNGTFVLSEADLKKQLEAQLSQNISLLDLDRKLLVVDLYQVTSKEVPVRAELDITFEQNYILDGGPVVSPSSVLVKGPKEEIDTLRQISTTRIELANVATDFSQEVLLVFPKGLVNSIFSTNRVEVSGKVVKFSERIFEVPIKVINSPEGFQVKTFPNEISVLCKATIERLKDIVQDDFEVVVDYKQVGNSSGNVLFAEIAQGPENIYDLRLLDNKVNFVLEQE